MNGKVNKVRLDRVLGKMSELGLDQIFVTDPSSVNYLTGLRSRSNERCNGIYIDRTGRVVAYMNELQNLFTLEGGDMAFYHDNDDPIEGLKKLLIPGSVGVDRGWPAMFTLRLMEACPGRAVVADTSVDRVRMVKDSEEQELLRKSSLINDEVVEASIVCAREGMSEMDMSRIVNANFARHPGVALGGFCLVQFGANCADPHHGPADDTLHEGDAVLLDIGKPICSYYCDTTRTAFLGKASAFQEDIYNIVLEANLAGEKAAGPGVPACEIDAASRQVIEKAGYGKYYTHRTGHNIGIDGHEWPDISLANPEPVVPGMCFSVEPGIYIPGVIGVRVEDLVLITEDGAEVLNKSRKDFRIL